MSGKKKSVRRLGKGLNALIPGGVSDELEGDEVISDKVKSDAVISEDVTRAGAVTTKFPEEVVEKAMNEGLKNPRVVVWSPKASIAMRILKKTIPEFSISKITSEILEEGIKERYPEVWEIVEQKVGEKKS